MLKQYHSRDDRIDDMTDDLTDNTKPVLASSIVEVVQEKTIHFESKKENNFLSPRLPNAAILSDKET